MPLAGDRAQTIDSPMQPETQSRERDTLRLQRAQSLDRNTLGGIYDEYQPRLYSYIYRRVGEVEVARDLTSDVFRRFLQATADGSGPKHNLRAWLYRVAHNVVIDHYRRREKQQSLPLQDNWISTDSDPGRAAEQQIRSERVRAIMGQLTPEQQQVIALKFLEGLTNDEVAEIMEKSVGAVKSLQHRALAALRRRLIPDEQERSP